MRHPCAVRQKYLVALVLFVCAVTLSVAEPARAPKSHSLVSLPQLDAIAHQAIDTRQIPGAVILVGHNGHIIFRKAFGWRSLEPRREPMTADTIFDIASLTKVVATTTCIMRLVELGQVRLNDPVMRYIPEFGVNGKMDITVRELLTHYSGLAPDIDLNRVPNDYNSALQVAFQEKPISPPGARFIYSDTNFIVLGALVERVSGVPLDKYAEAHVFRPLKMADTGFRPPASWLPKIAPTEYDERGVMLRGIVHDPRARRVGGVAGHAGLFSTADDLAMFCQALLAGGEILSPLTIEKMTTPQQPPTATSVRGLGWDIDSPLSSNRGELLPVGSFGHTGWTGTSLWIDPTTRTNIIILSNSVHPRGEGSAVSLRSKVATAVAASLHLEVAESEKLRLERITGYNEANYGRNLQVRNGNVAVGLDVLEARNFDLPVFHVPGTPKRIGVFTEPTEADSKGQRTIDVLAHAPGISVTAIFAPEYDEFSATSSPATSLIHDSATNVPIFPVGCGVDRVHPSMDVLKQLDAIFIDIQDSGTRINSCQTALGYFLEAAKESDAEIVMLDRPNPITGSFIQGPVADDHWPDHSGGYYPVPVRHGMTIGELAKMFNSERHIGARVTVVPMQDWIRGDWFDSTFLLWNPTPNLRSLTEATLYDGIALLEATNISVGRGTDKQFEFVGAPWVNPHQLATYLNAREIAGVRFVPTAFTPSSSAYAGQACSGVNIIVLDRTVLDVPELGIEMAAALRHLYPNQFKIDEQTELLTDGATLTSLRAGDDPLRIAAAWRDSMEHFEQVRQRYLIYR